MCIPLTDGTLQVAAIAASVAVTLIVALLVGICVLICIKLNTRKHEPAEVNGNSYHLAEYGLTAFVGAGELRTEGSLEKGFESSNFRVVKDALTQRLQVRVRVRVSGPCIGQPPLHIHGDG